MGNGNKLDYKFVIIFNLSFEIGEIEKLDFCFQFSDELDSPYCSFSYCRFRHSVEFNKNTLNKVTQTVLRYDLMVVNS